MMKRRRASEGFCTNCALNDSCDKEWISVDGCLYWTEERKESSALLEISEIYGPVRCKNCS